MQYAQVPVVPGPVAAVAAQPSSVNTGQWYPCGDAVAAAWTFDGHTFSPPPPPAPPAPTFSEVQAKQVNDITKGCAITIISNFTSTALGASYTYPSKMTDQINLLGAIMDSQIQGGASGWTINFWCADPSMAWAMRPHTAAQIQQVGTDAKTFISNNQNKLATLIGQIMAATTVQAVQAITWSPA